MLYEVITGGVSRGWHARPIEVICVRSWLRKVQPVRAGSGAYQLVGRGRRDDAGQLVDAVAGKPAPAGMLRITSYNVCYTKLLRLHQACRVACRRKAGGHLGEPPRSPPGSGLAVRGWARHAIKQFGGAAMLSTLLTRDGFE